MEMMSAAGITRKSKGKNVYYVDARGKNHECFNFKTNPWSCDSTSLDRCLDRSAQGSTTCTVTGFDARGRKQYRYHARWREQRDSNKYANLIAFAKVLPRIRKHVTRDLKKPKHTREKVLAAIVQLLETSLIRVGNDEYARDNHSFGLTTMHNRHAAVRGKKLYFRFRGKSGVAHEVDLESPPIARIVRKCQELPGQELFAYLDENGKVCDVGSSDVNNYLREISGKDISAKDFRTWAGNRIGSNCSARV